MWCFQSCMLVGLKEIVSTLILELLWESIFMFLHLQIVSCSPLLLLPREHDDLVGGFEHGFYCSIQLGMSSSQLTNSYFSEGLRPPPPTSDVWFSEAWPRSAEVICRSPASLQELFTRCGFLRQTLVGDLGNVTSCGSDGYRAAKKRWWRNV